MIQSIRYRIEKLGFGRDAEGLGGRAARGTFWLGMGSGGEYGLRMLRTIVLAKFFLPPEIFGLFAIVQVMCGGLESLTEVGVREAVVQHPKGDDRRYLNGVWFFSAARGVVLFLLGIVAAPWIAAFYDEPELTPYLRVAFLAILFNTMRSPEIYVAQKKIRMAKWAVVINGGAIFGIVLGCVLAIVYQNVWAFVIGFTVEAAARFLGSYILFPFLPKVSFDREYLRDLFRFSLGVLGVPVLAFVYAQSDILVLGRVVGSAELGMYKLALTLVLIPYTLCNTIITPILFPVLAELKKDPEATRVGVVRSVRALTLVTLPLLAVVGCNAETILQFVYGGKQLGIDQIHGIVPTFTVLCGVVALQVIWIPPSSLLYALGHPEAIRRASLFRFVVIAGSIVPLTVNWGTLGAASAMLLSSAAFVATCLWDLSRKAGLPVHRYLGAMAGGMTLGAIVIIGSWLIP